MEDAAMIEVTTQGNKERIREEIIELSQRIVALRNEKSIIEEKMTTAKTRNEELSRFSKELSLYNADCSEITDNKLRRIIQEVRIKKDHNEIDHNMWFFVVLKHAFSRIFWGKIWGKNKVIWKSMRSIISYTF